MVRWGKLGSKIIYYHRSYAVVYYGIRLLYENNSTRKDMFKNMQSIANPIILFNRYPYSIYLTIVSFQFIPY